MRRCLPSLSAYLEANYPVGFNILVPVTSVSPSRKAVDYVTLPSMPQRCHTYPSSLPSSGNQEQNPLTN